jgi:hypothetical protein
MSWLKPLTRQILILLFLSQIICAEKNSIYTINRTFTPPQIIQICPHTDQIISTCNASSKYNNLSLYNNTIFASINRRLNKIGMLDLGKSIETLDLDTQITKNISLISVLPSNIFILNKHIWVQVRYVGPTSKISGFEIFDLATHKRIKFLYLGQNLITFKTIFDHQNRFLHILGEATIISKSPTGNNRSLIDQTWYYKINYQTQQILTRQLISENLGGLEDMVQINKHTLAVSFCVEKQPSQTKSNSCSYIKLFDLRTLKFTKNIKHGFQPNLLAYDPLHHHLFVSGDSGQLARITMQKPYPFKQTPLYGIRDMVFKNQKLYLIHRFTIINGYQDPPKISIINPNNLTTIKELPGIFGPFALEF